ncbi:MAG: nitrite reductase (NADH) small subunit [Psychromonas sp.]|jgi:nitrite reductase (NADH) small subunit|uniref:nitrite reductase small subunit NirD n=1 Tax=Psychromonas sp. TaxID=1884585 RepID=UPI0039E48B3C
MKTKSNNEWIAICAEHDLTPNAGTCVQFKEEQVAIFYCLRSETLYAVANFDPIGQANVISRGIMGSIQGKTYVSSPLYKQHFDLLTGECLESPDHALKAYQVRMVNALVQLKAAC